MQTLPVVKIGETAELEEMFRAETRPARSFFDAKALFDGGPGV